MRSTTDLALFSPSDLNHFLECEHLIQLDLRRGDAPPAVRDAHVELLAEKGLEHERAWLRRFREEGRHVVEIAGSAGRDWTRDAERTLAAMQAGADVVYQGVMVEGDWRGVSDFLVKTEGESAWGGWTYEAWDTKLARSSKPYFVLQLCYYSGQLGRRQGRDPEQMHVILGTGETTHLAYAGFAAYYRAVRRRFLDAVASGRATYPYPVPHCGLCAHERACQAQWQADDHLSLVAGITRGQVERLNEAGIQTVAQLGALASSRDSDVREPEPELEPEGEREPEPEQEPRTENVEARTAPPSPRLRISPAALARLTHQAVLQTHYRRTGTHRYDLLPVDERSGFRLLPRPSPGDVFFDMEGDPYFEPARGLEYLFGAVTTDPGRPEFHAFQALDRAQEKVAFEQFIDFVHARLARWPDLHVYHYAAYETASLKRLMSEHATREAELDDLLRRGLFVDLYQVVRQSLRISHPSYSIKKVRTFFMRAGEGTVTDGADSILQFERWRITRDPAILQAIRDYNEEDCVSTARLRDWLLERKTEAERAAGLEIPWNAVESPKESERRETEDAETARRIEALVAGPEPTPERQLLAHLLGYHRREAKPEWWAYFDRRRKGLDDLLDDTQAIAALTPVPVEPKVVKQSLVYTLAFPDQEFKLDAGSPVIDPFTGESPSTIEWIDTARCTLGLKRGKRRAAEPLPVAVCAAAPIDDSAQRRALGRLADAVIADAPPSHGEQVCGPAKYSAVRALLAGEPPRVSGVGSGAGSGSTHLQTLDLEEQKRLVSSLDASHLFIQGPPGSGKTWTGARLIVALMAAGKRVGVAANSHKAINNLLAEVEAAAAAAGVAFAGLKKGTGDDEFAGRCIANTDDNEEIERACAVPAAPGHPASVSLVAGTAWLFAREAMDQSLDYLFIDEAGQVALADAVAMGTAARCIVLLGDPQQLPQVRQGAHPSGAGRSVLEHLLGGAATVAPDRGLFLAQTWRLHPDICRFVSALSYDGRLASAPGCERQRVDSQGLAGAGLRFRPVAHDGNAQESSEEAAAIAADVSQLLDGGTFTDADGRRRALTAADILVVAPYNMQVRCLREALPSGVEVGTVDKFQGREAPVVFFSMACSTGDDIPRGPEFLLNRNRFNVALSRARALAVVVCSPRLLDMRCGKVEQMALVNVLCRFAEESQGWTSAIV